MTDKYFPMNKSFLHLYCAKRIRFFWNNWMEKTLFHLRSKRILLTHTSMLMQYKQLFSTTIVFSCLVWVWICCSVIVHFLGLPFCYSHWQHKVYSQIVLCLLKCSLQKLNLKFNNSRVHWSEFEQVKYVLMLINLTIFLRF